MGHVHLSRRELLASIPVLTSGSVLAPLQAQRPDAGRRGVIRGSITDPSGKPVAAKIRVIDTADDQAYFPEKAIRTMPAKSRRNVRHYFYARGNYEIALPPGRFRIEVVRGITHDREVQFREVGAGVTHVHDFVMRPISGAPSGWYGGNTHTHYHLEIDEEPDDRLRMVPPAEALDVSVISYLIRNDAPYITNRYPIGRLPQFSKDGTIMDMGEEARNNRAFGDFGYGHCLFLNIPRAIEPVSTGLLSADGKAPDFPTLSMLCAEAQKIGGTTVWCHNGSGMELPVAAALGNVNAYNLADGLDPDYERYYGLLNCGFRIPASSGTDWWIYDHNRVFVQTQGAFNYDSWIAGLRAGRTFVSNGPLLELTVNGRGAGSTLDVSAPLRVVARAVSRIDFDRIEIVVNGQIVAEQSAIEGREARLEREVPVDTGGWIAARAVSRTRSHGGALVFAHTSPVYLRVAGTPHRVARAAGGFIDEIETSMRFIRKMYKFAGDADRATAIGRFEEARRVYGKLVS